jgi:DNA-binding transcriptional ArsR family regulator
MILDFPALALLRGGRFALAKRKVHAQIPDVLGFLAHSTRRGILIALARRQMTIQELAERLDLTIAEIRYHAMQLEDRRLITTHRRTLPYRYRLSNRLRIVFLQDRAVISIRLGGGEEILLKVSTGSN